jgi:hypothetical protein
MTMFRNSLPVLKIYSIRNMNYRFSVLAVYIETQGMSTVVELHSQYKTSHVIIK